jgi:NTP pyrophosphatase (non-canonical NTP hydrolase)
MIEKLYALARALNRRFPDGNDPFKMMTRLLEESGELAQQINHFENTGTKHKKYGEPDRAHLAKEVSDVLHCALQVALYYNLEAELEAMIESRYQRVKAEGLIEESR